MEEKIREEFNKDWSIDYTKENLDKCKRTIESIKDLTNVEGDKEDIIGEIKELIKELEYEISG